MIIGDVLTIDGRTYELSADQRVQIEELWDKCQSEAAAREAELAEDIAENEGSAMFCDDSAPSRPAYEAFRTAVIELVTGKADD